MLKLMRLVILRVKKNKHKSRCAFILRWVIKEYEVMGCMVGYYCEFEYLKNPSRSDVFEQRFAKGEIFRIIEGAIYFNIRNK